ncbi:ATP-binding protein [Hyphomonas sp.]|uniref:ATP-binding protein n=1 Tax=Hyphomonas sp. TaxID=87 RepID=UPI0032D98054
MQAWSWHIPKAARGRSVWLDSNFNVIRDENGTPVVIMASYHNGSDLSERGEALADAQSRPLTATGVRTEFLSNISHEIRTPLNGILGFIRLVTETELTDEQANYLDNILRAGTRLREVVDDMLDFSKIEDGQLDLTNQPVNLLDLTRNVVRRVDAGRKNKTATLSCILDGCEKEYVFGDEMRLRQVLTNLVGNAAKFTRQGHVTLTTRIQDSALIFEVKDTGQGIPRDKLASVLNGFRQANSTHTRRFGGLGLGLTISRSLTELMDGQLVLDSEEGVGTTVTVTLPYLPANKTGHIAQRNTDEASLTGRIMVVDDVEMNLNLMRHGLKHKEYHIETFTSAKAALTSLRHGKPFDLIFMDVDMPDMDGLTATRHIRAMDGPVGKTPIVALTAHALPAQIKECLDAGMTDHFPKPIDLDKMRSVITAILDGRRVDGLPMAPSEIAPMGDLNTEYLEYLGTIATKFDMIMTLSSEPEVLRAVAALAHAVAGSAGSFGFHEVSEAAFKLEAKAMKQIKDASLDTQALQEKIADLVFTSTQAIMA